MTRPLIEALHRRPVAHPPVWVMRQAGRYLPEYRKLRESHSFQEAVSNPDVAAEITLQPIRRYGMDGAVIFADIMTPLEAMGVEITFDPGPRLRPHTLAEVASLAAFQPDRVSFVGETIRRVGKELSDQTAIIGFAGAPYTLLAYLVEGGGSKDFVNFRGALRRDPAAGTEALRILAEAMRGYLAFQAASGAHAIQLFDSWAGLADKPTMETLVLPNAAAAISGLEVPTIYFALGAAHALESQPKVGASCYGVDWRVPIDEAWDRLGDVAVQGNLDPSVLLADPGTIRAGVADLLARTNGRPGFIANLGHGIDRRTPVENLAAFVEAVRS